MELPFFTMKTQLHGQRNYALLCVAVAIPFALLTGLGMGAVVFLALAICCSLFKKHNLVVFDESITNKDDRGRFLRKVTLDQISHYRRNFLGEIVLVDAEGNSLLCVEPYLTNRDRFEQWLAAHHIESK